VEKKMFGDEVRGATLYSFIDEELDGAPIFEMRIIDVAFMKHRRGKVWMKNRK